MRRIIQKYQEGGVVQPAVNTGVPQGGNAASAIKSYLSGNVSGPLSYTASESNTPDYRAMAADRARLRAQLAATGASIGDQVRAINDADAIVATERTNTKSTGSDGTTSSWGSDQDTYGAPGGFWGGNSDSEGNLIRNDSVSDDDFWDTFESGESSGGLFTGGGSDGAGQYGVLGDIGGGVRNIANASIVNRGYKALTGNDLISKYVQPESITNYSNNEAIAGISNTGSPINATSNINTNNDDSSDSHKQMVADHQARVAAETKAIESDMSDDDFWDAWEGNDSTTTTTSTSGGGWSNSGWNPKNWNNGGDVTDGIQTYNNGSIGGVAVANTGLREDEIRQRQMMQSQIQPEQKSPLSGIGESLMTGAINNGVNTGLATMAGKEGLTGTLGTMMGSGGVGATAATGGLGAGMMATLGPIGIGLGLGKLFGLFNDGGKVPYTKLKKSPLSGE